MTKKRCTKCKQERPIKEFGLDSSRKDKLQCWCKVCFREYRLGHVKKTAAYRKKNRIHLLAHNKDYRQTDKGKESFRDSSKRYRLRYPETDIAQNKLRGSKLKRSVFCEECGLPAKTEGHHPNYDKQLKVIWLCQPCHISVHKNLRIGGR